MRHLSFLILLLFLVACGSTNVIYDYDEQQDFGYYKTYNFFPKMHTGLGELDHKRLLQLADSTLQTLGLTKSETPDLYVNFKTALSEQPSNNSLGIGVGTGRRGINIGVGGAIPIGGPVTFMELVTDLVDVRRDELVWQAIAEKRFDSNNSPNAHKAFFQQVIARSFQKYPPSK